LETVAASHPALHALVATLRHDLTTPPEQREIQARRFAQTLVLATQGALMLQHAPQAIADAFIASRIDAHCGRVYGTLTEATLQQHILARAWPT
jgi:putative acyl-CoA dehydrogenase